METIDEALIKNEIGGFYLHPWSCRPMLKRSRDHTRGLGTLHGWETIEWHATILNSATVGMAPDLTLDSGIEGKPRSWLYAYSYPCRRVWPGY
jgi:hypothetical protein